MSNRPAWNGVWDAPTEDRPAVFSESLAAPSELAVPRVRSTVIDPFAARLLEDWSLSGETPGVISLPCESDPPAVISYRFHAPAITSRKPNESTSKPKHETPPASSAAHSDVALPPSEDIALPDLPDTLTDDVDAVSGSPDPNAAPETLPFIVKTQAADALTENHEAASEETMDAGQIVDEVPPLVLKKPKYTRLQPPGEIVSMEDRLFYLLQPALETLLVEKDLHFPFHPFPYQMQGMAFLFPRRAAMLADEMGLGKTMQAISGIRLLLHAGEARNILLVCPKPLVSNWKREFALGRRTADRDHRRGRGQASVAVG
ncbi:MAG: SNF2-related protein [Pirellulales bacterium]